MPELTPWKDKEIDKFRREMDRLFSRMWTCLGISSFYDDRGMESSTRLSESEDSFLFEMELPGIDPEDLDISVTRDSLTVSCYRREKIVAGRGNRRNLGTNINSFSRTVTLPYKVKINKVKAVYKNETLTIEMPKMKPEKPGKIKIELK
jgi:HSP20 family protein